MRFPWIPDGYDPMGRLSAVPEKIMCQMRCCHPKKTARYCAIPGSSSSKYKPKITAGSLAAVGFILLVILFSPSLTLHASPPACSSLLVNWEPLLEIVSRYGSAEAVERFRSLEDAFERRTFCIPTPPDQWHDVHSGEVIERFRILVKPWLWHGNTERVNALFEEINRAKPIRGFEHSREMMGCTEVRIELKISKGMYAIAESHFHRRWDLCPVQFEKNIRGISVLSYTGVLVR